MKLKTNPKQLISGLYGRLKSQHISLRFLLLDLLLIAVIFTLSFNIFLAYRDGVENLGRLRIEEEKLIKLQAENRRLSGEESYYRSIEFRKAYARDSLNLTTQGETLYMVLRDTDREEKVETVQLFDPEQLDLLDLWKLLILGG